MEEIRGLTDLVWQLGQWEFAIVYTKKLYEFCHKKLGAVHKDTALAAHLTGTVYYNQNQTKQACIWYAKAWNIYEKLEKKEPVTEACLRMKYSRYLCLEGDYPQMEEMYMRIEKIYRTQAKKEKGKREAQQLQAGRMNFYIERERAYLKLEWYEEAWKICRRAKRFHEEIKDGQATGAYIYHDLAFCLMQQSHYEEAYAYLRKAKKMAEQHFGKDYVEVKKINADLKILEKDWTSTDGARGNA